MNNREFLELLDRLYGEEWPKPLHRVRGARLVDEGWALGEAAREVGTNQRSLRAVLDSPDRVASVLDEEIRHLQADQRNRAIGTLGQLLLGRAAETAFEEIHREEMEEHELELRDLRESRSDTDYRLYNGEGRPVYRINIKFHGTLFRRAEDLVGLEPKDCFALATYKIHGALEKQVREGLPYIFAVVGVRSLSGDAVGEKIPSKFIDATAFIYQSPKATGKRDFEDRIVEHLVENEVTPFPSTFDAIRAADWYIVSARRADHLVRQMLYERVFALRVPRFAQQFRGAELDMHFSLSEDLNPLQDFFRTLRGEGQAKVVTLLERGVF